MSSLQAHKRSIGPPLPSSFPECPLWPCPLLTTADPMWGEQDSRCFYNPVEKTDMNQVIVLIITTVASAGKESTGSPKNLRDQEKCAWGWRMNLEMGRVTSIPNGFSSLETLSGIVRLLPGHLQWWKPGLHFRTTPTVRAEFDSCNPRPDVYAWVHAGKLNFRLARCSTTGDGSDEPYLHTLTGRSVLSQLKTGFPIFLFLFLDDVMFIETSNGFQISICSFYRNTTPYSRIQNC